MLSVFGEKLITKFIYALLLFSLFGCHVKPTIKELSSVVNFTLKPRNAVLYVNETLVLTPEGGAGGFKFQILSQSGTGAFINEDTGEIAAGSVAAENQITVMAVDKINQHAYGTVRVFENLTLSAHTVAQPDVAISQVVMGQNLNFSVTGGLGPYRFTASAGVINSTTGDFILTNGVSSVNVTVTDANNRSKSITFPVADPLKVSFVAGTGNAVLIKSMKMNSSVPVYVSGGVGNYTLSIDNGGGTTLGTLSASSATYSASASSPSSFQFNSLALTGNSRIVVKDEVQQTIAVEAQIVDLVKLNVAEVTVQKSTSVSSTYQFGVTGGKGPFVFAVEESNASFSAVTGAINSSSGLYTAPTTADLVNHLTRLVSVTDSLGQKATAIVHISEGLTMDLSSTNLMVGTQTQISTNGGSGTITITAPTCGSIIGINNDFFKAPDTVPPSPFICRVVATDSNGNSVSKDVRVYPQIDLVLSKNRIAKGGAIDLNVQGGVPNSSGTGFVFSIVTGDGSIVAKNAPFNIYTFNSSSSSTFSSISLKVTDTEGNSSLKTLAQYTPLSVLPISSAVINRNEAYSFLSAGGFGNITWSLSAGSVGGFDSYSGGPQSPSTAVFKSNSAGSGSVIAKDEDGNQVTVAYQILDAFGVQPNPIYIQRSPDSGTPTTIQLAVTGGAKTSSAPYYNLSIIQSNLVNTAASQGSIQSGTSIYVSPKSDGTEKIRVTDAGSNSLEVPVTIYNEMVVTPASSDLIKGLSVNLQAIGGVLPYTWEITSSSGAPGQGSLTVGGDTKNATYDSTGHSTSATAQVEITVRDSKPGTPNTSKVYVNISQAAAVTQVDSSVGSQSSNSYFNAGKSIPITVTFSKPVVVTGAPKIQLNSHVSSAFANYLSGSGSAVLTFQYTVAAGENASRLDYLNSSSLILNSGSIVANGVNAVLTLPTPNGGSSDLNAGSLGSLSHNKKLVIDTLAPVAPNLISLVNPSSSPGSNTTPTISVGSNLLASHTLEVFLGADCAGSPATQSIPVDGTLNYTTGTLSQGVYTFTAKQVDQAGNKSACSSSQGVSGSKEYVLDLNQPVASSISVADLDSLSTTHTNSTSVKLTLSALYATQMYITNTSGCASGGSYESYASTKNWSLTSGDGDKVVYFKVKNALGTESACIASNTIKLDTLAPSSGSISLALKTPATSPGKIATPVITVSGVVSQDSVKLFSNNTCTTEKGSAQASSTQVDVTTSALADGDHTFYAHVIDPAGNISTCSTASVSYHLDTTSPTVTLSTVATNPFNSSSITVTAVFSEAVTGFDLSDIVVTNGTASVLSGSGSNYSFTVTPSALGQVRMNIPVNSAIDHVGNGNLAATELSRTFDNSQPSVTLSTSTGAAFNTSNFVVNAVFSESVTGFLSSEITVINGSASGFSGSGANYSFTVTPTSQGSVTVRVAANVAQNTSGNGNLASNDLVLTYDSMAPTITGMANDSNWVKSKTWNWGCNETCSTRFVIDTSASTNPSGAYGSITTATQSSGTGTYYIHIQSQDALGNGSAVQHFSAKLDNTNPNAPTSVVDGQYLNQLAESPMITFTLGTDAHSGVQSHEARVLKLSDSTEVKTWAAISSNTKITGLSLAPNTSYKVEVRTIDNVGNVSGAAVSDGWLADTTPPTSPTGLNFGAIPSSGQVSPALSWTNSTDTGGSGVDYYQVQIYNSSNSAISAWSNLTNGGTVSGLSLSSGQQYYFKVRAYDRAGNVSSESASSSPWTAVSLGIAQEAYVKAVNNPKTYAYYGSDVAIYDDTMVVGAYGESSSETTITNGSTAGTNTGKANSGAAYVYRKTVNGWEQEAFIKAVNGDADDQFGRSVAISGDTIAVSAILERSNQTNITNGTTASSTNGSYYFGAVYVYKRSGTNWQQEAYIKASNNGSAAYHRQFGSQIDLDQNTLIVGDSNESSNQVTITNGAAAASTNTSVGLSGAVFVYFRSGSTWAQQAYIKAFNGESSDRLGYSVDLHGDLIVAGAPFEDSNQNSITNGSTASSDNSIANAGAAYVFKRTGSNWSQQAYLKPSVVGGSLNFGSMVAIHGDTIAVGTNNHSYQNTISHGTTVPTDTTLTHSGAVYIFKYNGSAWTQEAFIKPSNAGATDHFGHKNSSNGYGNEGEIALYGDTLVVGVPAEDSSQNFATVGTEASSDETKSNSGAVYVFTRTGSTWSQQAYIKAKNVDDSDGFGTSISLFGDVIAIGTPDEDDPFNGIINGTEVGGSNNTPSAGAVYIYRRTQ